MTKKTVLCVIAHPDDEAFGPSGTLAKLARVYDVHIVCVTDGQSDPRFQTHPGEVLVDKRAQELQASAQVLGAKEVHFLHFKDGTLSNNLYHEIAAQLTNLVKKYKPFLLITNEMRGNSGHLDHVAVSMVTSYVYRENRSIDALWYTCTSKSTSDLMGKYFVFFPPGFTRESVDLIVDVASVFTKKLAAAKCHRSQYKDALGVIAKWLISPKEELFLVTTRKPKVMEELKATLT